MKIQIFEVDGFPWSTVKNNRTIEARVSAKEMLKKEFEEWAADKNFVKFSTNFSLIEKDRCLVMVLMVFYTEEPE